MPEATERPAFGSAAWRVRDKLFVWERPLRKSDRNALGDAAPDGPILGAKVELVKKTSGSAWLAAAPKRLAREWLSQNGLA